MPWYPRNCTWCGVRLAARTNDPDVLVACMACDDSPDLPLEPDGSDVTGERPGVVMPEQPVVMAEAPADLWALCMRAYHAADPSQLADRRTRWVMDLAYYKQIRATFEAYLDDEQKTDPETWVPDPGDLLMVIPIDVREDGGEPHLETPDGP